MKNIIYLMTIGILCIILTGCSIEKDIQGNIGNKELNSYIVSDKYKSIPIYDEDTNKIVGHGYKGFSLNIDMKNNDKVYFEMQTSDGLQKSYYIPIKYLEKGYKEPFVVITIISSDAIIINKNSPIYDDDGNIIAEFNEDLGPMRYIQKTDRGYQFTLANNLVYVKESDIKGIIKVD